MKRRHCFSLFLLLSVTIMAQTQQGVVKTLQNIEAATLSETFWNVAVVQNLIMTSTNNPTYLVFLAAQVMMNDVSLLSNNVLVRELIDGGDVSAAERLIGVVVGHRIGNDDLCVRAIVTLNCCFRTVGCDGEIRQHDGRRRDLGICAAVIGKVPAAL